MSYIGHSLFCRVVVIEVLCVCCVNACIVFGIVFGSIVLCDVLIATRYFWPPYHYKLQSLPAPVRPFSISHSATRRLVPTTHTLDNTTFNTSHLSQRKACVS